MARQRIHNRRAGHGSGSGPSWISYSDMMAALVLIFVLFLVYNLNQYNKTLQIKTEQLASQQALLDEQEGLIIIQQSELKSAQADLSDAQDKLVVAQTDLKTAQDELAAKIIILGQQQDELDELRASLEAKELALTQATEELEKQRLAFTSQTQRITSIVGVRTEIIQALSTALTQNNITAAIDPTTGDITLESTVFFETGSFVIKPEGQALLNSFVPVYLNILLSDEYSDYLGEIIIEGHTDSSGGYLSNLELSQNRALAVAKYCLSMPGLSDAQVRMLMKILTAKGRSYSDLVYNADGTENKEASRRVEFKFSLRDSEMIQEMQQILDDTAAGGSTVQAAAGTASDGGAAQ